MTARPLLEVSGLTVDFATEAGVVHAVDSVSLELAAGEILAIVGESGAGKSVAATTLLGLTRSPNARISGSVRLRGRELIGAPEVELRSLRGAQIAIVFQDPAAALNPVQRVGRQIAEQIRAHEGCSRERALERAVASMQRAGVPRARDCARAYPHELSGGMRQRVMIAMALSCSPSVLIADEPTTALDVTVQAQILDQINQLRGQTQAGVILISHDLGVVAEVADRVAVMYAGRIVEQGTLDDLFYDPQHPYTWGLLGSIMRIDRPRSGPLHAIGGRPPSPLARPPGCHFQPRCPHEFERCGELPALAARVPEAPGHHDRCWLEPAEKRRRRRAGEGIGLGDGASAGS